MAHFLRDYLLHSPNWISVKKLNIKSVLKCFDCDGYFFAVWIFHVIQWIIIIDVMSKDTQFIFLRLLSASDRNLSSLTFLLDLFDCFMHKVDSLTFYVFYCKLFLFPLKGFFAVCDIKIALNKVFNDFFWIIVRDRYSLSVEVYDFGIFNRTIISKIGVVNKTTEFMIGQFFLQIDFHEIKISICLRLINIVDALKDDT